MSKRILSLILVFVLMIALGLTGCSRNNGDQPTNTSVQGTEDTETKEKGVDKPTDEGYGILKNATSHAAKLINPHDYNTSYEDSILDNSQGALYGFYPQKDGDTYQLITELAEGDPVQVDKEGKVWQIKINKNAKWANGEDMNADDFIYSWKMVLDPKLLNRRAATFAKQYITITKAEDYAMQLSEDGRGEVKWEEVGIKKIDDYTVEITSENNQVLWDVKHHFSTHQSSPVYKPMYEELMNEDRTETRYGTEADKYMSSGAFMLESWIKDSERKYIKNPYFVKKDVIWLKGIHTKVIKDSGTQMQLFESGELDYISLSAEDYIRYEEDPRVLFSPSTVVRHMPINMDNPDKPILGNNNFRKALFYAMDRQTLADLGKQTPANYIISSRKVANLENGIRFRAMDEAQEYLTSNYGYDPKLAVEYFDKALQEEGIDKVSLTLNYYETREDVKKMSEYIQKALPEIFGKDRFELKLQSLPNNQLFATMKSHKLDPRSYEWSWTGWAGYEFAPWHGMRVYTSDYKRKNEPFKNEKFDELYEKANYGEGKNDIKERVRLTAEMEKILLEELPFIPIFEPLSKYLKADRVKLPLNRWVNGVGLGWRYSRIVEE